MGHFKAFVLLPHEDADDIEASTYLALAPYWLGHQVEPYQDHCGCTWAGNPYPDCPDCKGTGLAWYTSPPEARWDWYQIKETLNLPLQKRLRIYPDAIVDADGIWHEERTGVAVNPEWHQLVERLLQDHDGIAVVVDYHL